MSGSGAAGGALAGVALALMGYSGLSFAALALVVSVLIRVFVTSSARNQAPPSRGDYVTYDI